MAYILVNSQKYMYLYVFLDTVRSIFDWYERGGHLKL